MFGKNPRLNPLAWRKQLLIAESELSRAQWVSDMTALTAGVHTLTAGIKSFGTLASAGALLVTGLAAFRRERSGSPDVRPSWWSTILKGAGLVSTIWLAFRSQGRESGNR